MSLPVGKLIAIGGAEDKGSDREAGEIHRNNLNFFELDSGIRGLELCFRLGRIL